MAAPLQRHIAGLLAAAGDEPTPVRALAHALSARHHLWRGDFARAAEAMALTRADAQWAAHGAAPVRAFMFAYETIWHAMRGEREAAARLMQQRIDENKSGYGQSGIHHLLQFAVRLAAIADDLPLLRSTLARFEAAQRALAAQTGSAALRRVRIELPLAGNVAWLEGRGDDAIALWQEALTDAERIDLLGQASDVRVRLACALLRRNRVAEAAAALQPAFAQADAEQAPGGILFAGDALREVAAFDWQDALPPGRAAQLRDWWNSLAAQRGAAPLGASAASSASTSASSSAPSPAMPPSVSTAAAAGSSGAEFPTIGPLTRRELEVLARIAIGDSNKLIARAFDLSLHTVKRHVAHILDKLQLDSRGQAAAWYRRQAAP
jgi:LuxR family maltose regulon positive regulatory protein